MPERNWAGTYTYGARTIHRPRTVDELQDVVSRAAAIRAIGSRHSFSDIADSAELVSLDAFPLDVRIDERAGFLSCSGNARYADLFDVLDRAGLALQNLASLPHINVAGAIATATHGSGDANGNLATAVRTLDLVTSDGEIRTYSRGDADFDGVVVGLGSLGVVTRIELDVEPAYELFQTVYERLPWTALDANLDDVFASAHSVSVCTTFADDAGDLWVKSRDAGRADELFGAAAATVQRHPIAGLDPANCTAQLGQPGAWWDRLPHFRAGFTPSSGEELQSEYLVPRRHALDAIAVLRALRERLRPVLQVAEVRTIPADDLWMSPQHGTDTIGIHFTWRKDADAVLGILGPLEAALEPFDARPHWGKLFLATADRIAGIYPRRDDFVGLTQRLDPRGVFRNAWLVRHVLGGG